MSNSYSLSYALVTPARNEEAFIEKTIRSVINQTVLPIIWVIVSDGSTDRTDEIINRFLPEYNWIKLIRMPEHRDRQFAAKVFSFNAGYKHVDSLSLDVIGSLDADISFDPEYFEYLLSKFSADQQLGVIGTPFVEDGKHYDYRFTNIEHVSGACQLFRTKCFYDIGGYMPIKSGGIDWVAVTTARMKGWKTRTFTEKVCFHHRKMGTGNTRAILTSFRLGIKDYTLGNRPLWQIFRAFYQMTNKPYILSGIFLLSGYFWAGVNRFERPISKELIEFIQGEQIRRLKRVFKRFFTIA